MDVLVVQYRYSLSHFHSEREMTEVTGIDTKGGKVVGVNTSKGYISTNRVLSAVAGFTPRITEMVDLDTLLVVLT